MQQEFSGRQSKRGNSLEETQDAIGRVLWMR
jgi:hypothetical protein